MHAILFSEVEPKDAEGYARVDILYIAFNDVGVDPSLAFRAGCGVSGLARLHVPPLLERIFPCLQAWPMLTAPDHQLPCFAALQLL